MTEERNDLRFEHIEGDVVELKSTDKEQARNITEIEKGNIKKEIFIEDIFKKLIIIEANVSKSLKKSTATEALALDLKKQADIRESNTKWSTRFWKTAAYTNGIVFVVWVLQKLFTYIATHKGVM